MGNRNRAMERNRAVRVPVVRSFVAVYRVAGLMVVCKDCF
jgi:hypothetical protein